MSTGSGHVLIARLHDLYADGYLVGYGGKWKVYCRVSNSQKLTFPHTTHDRRWLAQEYTGYQYFPYNSPLQLQNTRRFFVSRMSL